MGNALNQLNLATGPGDNGILASGGQQNTTSGPSCQILSGLWVGDQKLLIIHKSM